MKSKGTVAGLISCAILGLGLVFYFAMSSGWNRSPKVAPPVAKTLTAQEIKATVALLNGSMERGPFGVNIKAEAAGKLADLGQAAKGSNAIPELTKLSKNGKVEKVARDAAVAALAKLNAPAESPEP